MGGRRVVAGQRHPGRDRGEFPLVPDTDDEPEPATPFVSPTELQDGSASSRRSRNRSATPATGCVSLPTVTCGLACSRWRKPTCEIAAGRADR